MKTFEDYLKEVHAKNYMGTDDDMPDSFDNWVSNLDASEIMEYAEQAIKDIQEPWGINLGRELQPNN